jgi:hypothetical protein
MQGNKGQPSAELHEIAMARCFANRTNKRRKRDRNSEEEYSTKKQTRPHPTYQNARPVEMNNFFAPLRDLPMQNAKMDSEGKLH